jgi:RNA polymerase sigma-70 factor (TIGR02943 family)
MPEKPKPNPNTWVDKYSDFLYRYAMSRVNNIAVAEDLVQETFYSALKAFANFDGKSSERTWFVSILKHKIIDFYRKKSRQAKYFDEPAGNEPSDDYEENGFWKLENAPADWGDRPEEALHQKEFLLILEECLTDLPQKIAAVFTLREMEGIESKNICKELNISASNLWVMLHRARQQLRKCLELNWFGSTEMEH